MTQTSPPSRCSVKLFLHVVDCIALLLTIVLQGSILDYYLILHNGGSAAWYFWFLADFLILIAFMAAAVISYRHYRKLRLRRIEEPDSPVVVSQLSSYGSLPLVYIVWIFYSLLLSAKVILLFKLEVAQTLHAESTFGPHLLKIIIAASALVFLLLVETHNDAEPHSDSQTYINYLITSTVFEIFDSVTFLGILFPSETKIVLTYHLENAILCFSCVNFLLPTLALYKLSTSEFGQRLKPLGLKLLYKMLHLVLINIPYLVVRIYLWTLFDHDVTLFLLKNILGILLLLRTIYPDFQLWWQMVQENRHKRTGILKEGSDLSAVYEITDTHPEEHHLNEIHGKVPMMTQL